MIKWLSVFRISLLCIAASTPLVAQVNTEHTISKSSGDRLEMVVILSRHGVRSPIWTSDRLNAYSSSPWPNWSVPPGDLTPHGAELLRRFGVYDRASLAKAGLFAAQGCAAANETYIWADTDQRTLASAHALAEGLFPKCDAEVHSLARGEKDPLFHPALDGVDPAVADQIAAQVATRLNHLPEDKIDGLTVRLQRVLLGCKPDHDCTPNREPKLRLSAGPSTVVRGKGDQIVDVKGPLHIASTFSEILLLEYANGMPLQSVGWGNVDEAKLRQLLYLHGAYYEVIKRIPSFAKLQAADMLVSIERTLQQAVEGKPVAGAEGIPGEKLVMIAGHDTNIVGVAELLGLHWSLDSRMDDIPPGMELAFELWRTPQGASLVRITVTTQTLRQMREMQDLTPSNLPATQTVTAARCTQKIQACKWSEFRALVKTATASR